MQLNPIFIFPVTFFVNFLLTSFLKRFSLKYNFLNPKGIPLVGGLGMGVSFSLSCLFLPLISKISLPDIRSLLLPSLLILVSGAIDDWLEISVLIKFVIQFIAAFLLISLGLRTDIAFIGDAANIIITLFWVIAITNAFNLLDVSDGLAAGVAIIISLALFAVSVLNKDIKSASFSVIIAASSASLLLYNLPPAKIYIGNCGSHYLGFLFAVITMTISYATLERKVALVSPVLILWFPIFDTAFLILMRMLKGKSMFKKSNDHLAFRLLKLGYSRNKALAAMLSLALLFSLCGVLLSQMPDNYGIAVIGVILLMTVLITVRMSAVRVDE